MEHVISCRSCGVNTPHELHFTYSRSLSELWMNDYLLMYFKTPFLYKEGGIFRHGEKNRYILFPPDSPAEHCCDREGFVNDWIFISGEAAKDMVEAFQIPLSRPFRIDDRSIIEPYINKITTERKLKLNGYEQQIGATVTAMLVELGRQYEFSQKTTHPAFEAINNARIYMLNHIEENISVAKLAEQSNYSVSRFCVLYNKFFGVTPIEDLLDARIEKAITLLKYNRTSITETASLCGFASLHYFSRKFKEKTGVAPSNYLK